MAFPRFAGSRPRHRRPCENPAISEEGQERNDDRRNGLRRQVPRIEQFNEQVDNRRAEHETQQIDRQEQECLVQHGASSAVECPRALQEKVVAHRKQITGDTRGQIPDAQNG